MQNDAELNALGEQMRSWRRDIHQHPELGFQEHRTAGLVAKLLTDWAIDVHTGIGGTGVVGTIRGTGGPGPSLGLRADMDALPMTEKGSVEHRSTHDNVFHGCGHDGHTAILLGVAKHLASHRTFCGTVHLIFQPAEETLRGGSEMIRDGLFERFPCDEIYALHNNNALPAGKIGVRAGAILSACDLFRISIKGIGSHAAMPHKSIDPLVVGTTVVQSIQSIVSRNIDPLDTAVVSVCKFIAGYRDQRDCRYGDPGRNRTHPFGRRAGADAGSSAGYLRRCGKNVRVRGEIRTPAKLAANRQYSRRDRIRASRRGASAGCGKRNRRCSAVNGIGRLRLHAAATPGFVLLPGPWRTHLPSPRVRL